jgi:hypothetical protein
MSEPDEISDGIARDCAAHVRGCCTDEQYQDLVRRIALAIQVERDDHAATIRRAEGKP